MKKKGVTKNEVKRMQKMRLDGYSMLRIQKAFGRDWHTVKAVLDGTHPLAGAPTVPKVLKLHEKTNGKQTLCWFCKNACGGCNWSKFLLPVPGWDAAETTVRLSVNGAHQYDRSFFVKKCPQFSPEANYR